MARSLERVADHATIIVEYTYYVETGEMRQLAREEHGYGPNLGHDSDHHKTEGKTETIVPHIANNGTENSARQLL